MTTATALSPATLSELHEVDRARVTTHGFTNLLRAQTGEDIVPSVLHRDLLPASPVVAELLDVAAGTMIHRRKTLLLTATSRQPVTYAEAAIVLARLGEADQQAILGGEAPLGDILHVAYADRVLLGWRSGVDAPRPGGSYLASSSSPGSSVMQRLSVIRHAQPVALVAEWWPKSGVSAS